MYNAQFNKCYFPFLFGLDLRDAKSSDGMSATPMRVYKVIGLE